MSEPVGSGEAPAAAGTPPASAGGAAPPPPRRRGRWTDEWGLRILALVLAVLLWTLTRAGIEGESTAIYVHVRAEAIHPDQFVGFWIPDRDKPVSLTLQGTTAERDDAKSKLGADPTILVKVKDLEEGQDETTNTYVWPGDQDLIAVPFRPKLVKELNNPIVVRVFRLRTQRAVVKAPAFTGIPKGYEGRVVVEPDTVLVPAPFGVLGETIQPDPVDVAHLFEGGKVPEGPQEFPLAFDTWRAHPALATFRTVVALPQVKATVTFEARSTREIENALEVWYPGGAGDSKADYDWTIDSALPGIGLDGRRLTGSFRGGDTDLETLATGTGSWFYAVVVTPDKLDRLRTGGKAEDTIRAPLRWFSMDSLRRLNVEFVPPPAFGEVQVTVKRRTP